MDSFEKKIREDLFALQDLKYRDFHSNLMPNINKEKIIGIRVPVLRKFAKDFYRNGDYEKFLSILPHYYFEENNLHGLLIERLNDFDRCIFELDRFLPFVDNWATCDIISPKILKKHPAPLLLKIKEWINSNEVYRVRYVIELLMNNYLDENFEEEYLALVAGVKSEEYYVNMMIAWYFATALAKQKEAVLPFLEEKRLGKWVHNKTIQKAVESYRISEDDKNYLRTLRIK